MYDSLLQILSRFGTQVYKADEERTGCCNTCYGAKREFTINLYDATGRTFVKFHRPLKVLKGTYCKGIIEYYRTVIVFAVVIILSRIELVAQLPMEK